MKKENFEIIRHGMTESEIATRQGCTRQYVNQVIQSALKKLRPVAESLHLEEFLEKQE